MPNNNKLAEAFQQLIGRSPSRQLERNVADIDEKKNYLAAMAQYQAQQALSPEEIQRYVAQRAARDIMARRGAGELPTLYNPNTGQWQTVDPIEAAARDVPLAAPIPTKGGYISGERRTHSPVEVMYTPEFRA